MASSLIQPFAALLAERGIAMQPANRVNDAVALTDMILKNQMTQQSLEAGRAKTKADQEKTKRAQDELNQKLNLIASINRAKESLLSSGYTGPLPEASEAKTFQQLSSDLEDVMKAQEVEGYREKMAQSLGQEKQLAGPIGAFAGLAPDVEVGRKPVGDMAKRLGSDYTDFYRNEILNAPGAELDTIGREMRKQAMVEPKEDKVKAYMVDKIAPNGNIVRGMELLKQSDLDAAYAAGRNPKAVDPSSLQSGVKTGEGKVIRSWSAEPEYDENGVLLPPRIPDETQLDTGDQPFPTGGGAFIPLGSPRPSPQQTKAETKKETAADLALKQFAIVDSDGGTTDAKLNAISTLKTLYSDLLTPEQWAVINKKEPILIQRKADEKATKTVKPKPGEGKTPAERWKSLSFEGQNKIRKEWETKVRAYREMKENPEYKRFLSKGIKDDSGVTIMHNGKEYSLKGFRDAIQGKEAAFRYLERQYDRNNLKQGTEIIDTGGAETGGYNRGRMLNAVQN